MTHPAQLTERRAYWFGPEIEGVLASSRTHTLFLAGAVTPEVMHRALVDEAVAHIFLTEEFNDWSWLEAVLLLLLPRPITVARVGSVEAIELVLRLPFAAHLTIMARAQPAPWALLLRVQDQVSVGVDYDLLTFAVEDGVRSVPSDYESDYE